jgi:hypothetical protein
LQEFKACPLGSQRLTRGFGSALRTRCSKYAHTGRGQLAADFRSYTAVCAGYQRDALCFHSFNGKKSRLKRNNFLAQVHFL